MKKKRKNYSQVVDDVIRQSDIVLIILDARMVQESINRDLEAKILARKKKFLYVINKCDLLGKKEKEKIRLPNSMEISATKFLGTTRLMERLMMMKGPGEAYVGVVGLPNTGKSSVINALSGRGKAPTSSQSGFTKGVRGVRINRELMLLDTPGVLESGKNAKELVAIGVIDSERMKDPENAALDLISSFNGRVEAYFGLPKGEDAFETLEKISLKRNYLRKGGLPDTARMAKEIIRLIQRGKI